MRSFKLLLSSITCLSHIQVDTFDGDTSFKGGIRDKVRREARVIFTNPDMLHVSILPNHEYWKVYLANLKFVVVDGMLCLFLLVRVLRTFCIANTL